jgi:hypothetical protein
MFRPFAVFLSLAMTFSHSLAADSVSLGGAVLANVSSDNVPAIAKSGAAWSASNVATWAAAHSSTANLLVSERSAFASSIDREDRQQCVQLALVQSITRDLECHERQRAAAQALTAFHQLRGLDEQQLLLDEAYAYTEKLIRLAKKADELEIDDGNRFELEKQRLQIADQQAEASGGAAKLRVLLGQLTAKSYDEVEAARLFAPDSFESSWTLQQALPIGLTNRCDLKAIQSLCNGLNADSLPLARQVISTLQPGLGLAAAVASRRPLLAAIHSSDNASAAELCQRREQCAKLRQERESQIRAEIHVAVIDRDTAKKRLQIANEQRDIDEQLVKQSVMAIELDQATPGADIVATLTLLKSKGRVVQQQASLHVAEVRLREAMGVVLSD